MKIHLLQATRKTFCRSNKDTNGSYGTLNDFGNSLTSRLLTLYKKMAMNFPELSPAYASAILKSQGHEVTYGENQDNPFADITLLQSSLVHFNEEIRWAKKLKTLYPTMRVGFFSGVSDVLFNELLDVADFVISGEVESALMTGDIATFEGRVFGGMVQDLDKLAFPDWSHATKRRYSITGAQRHTRLAPMLASRGCPMSCSYYCTYPLVQGKPQRKRSIENIVAEMQHLKDKHGVNVILFRDPIFTLDMKRTKSLCHAIVQADLGINFIIETHCKFIDEEMVELLARSGCVAIQFGIESGNLEVMALSRRKVGHLDSQKDVIQLCETHGIKVFGLFMLAYFDDTEETIHQTIEYAKRLNPYGAQFTVATPYPGTPWYEELKRENQRYKLSENYDEYTQYQLVYQHPHLSSDTVIRLKNKAYKDFYYRPAYIKKHHLPGAH